MLELAPHRLFDGTTMLQGVSVVVDGGRVVELREPSANAQRIDGLLAPGLVDAQVNGGDGVLFNDNPTAETLTTMAAAHRSLGVTAILPTLISDDRSKIDPAIAAITTAIENGVQGIVGLHLEGPWLAPPRKGVHPGQHLRPFDARDLEQLLAPRRFPLMITAAPEAISLADIAKLSDAGVIVALGHTAANVEQIEAALAAGARGFTHLFNAMSQMEGRNPGAVGAALANAESWAGLILDGVHVHPTSARAAFAAKTARRLMLVSDAMATVGSAQPSMTLFGEQIAVKDGALRTATGVLAGAHLDLLAAVRNAVQMLGASQAEALQMATSTPAEFLRIDEAYGRILSGARADFVALDDEQNLRGVWVDGQPVDMAG